MKPHIPSDIFMIVISVAVSAKMTTGIICANVCTENAGTFCPLRFLFRHDKVAANRRFKGLLCHTATAVYSVGGKLHTFRTGFYGDAVPPANLRKGLAYGDTLLLCDRPSLRKIALDLFVDVNEADNADLCIARKCPAHLLKVGYMPFNGVGAVDEYRIIPPAHTVHSDLFGKCDEVLHDLFFRRNIRLNIFAVRCDRDEPILMIRFQLVKVFQHRCRILRAESKAVHHICIQLIASDPVGAVRVTHQHKSCPYPVHEPFLIKCRNIRPHTCVDYHVPHRPFFLFYHIQPVFTTVSPHQQ